MFTKVMSRFEHCICTNFGISDACYGGRTAPLGGLIQGMILSGSSNRYISFFVFKALEKKGLGFRNSDTIALEKMLKIVSAFVDDTNEWKMVKVVVKL